MKRIIQFIDNHSSGKKVLTVFILANLVYFIMLIVTIPKAMELAGGMALLDMMPMGYDLAYVNELFGALGTEGRSIYLTQQLPLDMIYPLLFAFAYCLLLAYLLKKWDKFATPFTYVCLLPLIGGIADYFENIGILRMLNSYPDVTEFVVNTTATFSVIKSSATSIYFLALLMVLIGLGIKALKKAK